MIDINVIDINVIDINVNDYVTHIPKDFIGHIGASI